MIFTIFCKRRSVEHAEFAIHLGCRKPCFLQLLAHIYTKNHEMFNEIITFYHDFQTIFVSFGTFIIVELLERFSLKRVVLFSKKSVFFHKNTPNIVTVSWIFFDIFLLFCVKNTKNMDFTKFEKGRCAA